MSLKKYVVGFAFKVVLDFLEDSSHSAANYQNLLSLSFLAGLTGSSDLTPVEFAIL